MTAQTSHSGENGAHTLTHTRAPGTQASENRHHHSGAQASSAQEALGRKKGVKNNQGASLRERRLCLKQGLELMPGYHVRSEQLRTAQCLTVLPWDLTPPYSAARRCWSSLGVELDASIW